MFKEKVNVIEQNNRVFQEDLNVIKEGRRMFQEEIKVLVNFLSTELSSGEKILQKFEDWSGVRRRRGSSPLEQFLYIPGNRKNKVLLVAHVDTVWDKDYTGNDNINPDININKEVISSNSQKYGIGADDRAGCAILWLLKKSGHSLLLTNGEERGGIGSKWLINKNKDISEKIQNEHQFVIQFDRRNGKDFKCYSVGTGKFKKFIKKKFAGYNEPDKISYTDIVTICKDITGVNLSVGYRNEHTSDEKIFIDEWINTLKKTRKLLKENYLPKFELN